MAKAEEDAMDTVLSENVIRRLFEKPSRSDESMRPIGVFVSDSVSHSVRVKMAEECFLHSPERSTIEGTKRVPNLDGLGGSVNSAHSEFSRCELRNKTDSIVNSFNTDEISPHCFFR